MLSIQSIKGETRLSQNSSSGGLPKGFIPAKGIIDNIGDIFHLQKQQILPMEGECFLKSTSSEKYRSHWVSFKGYELFWYKDRNTKQHVVM